jgi:hypothetical protein
VEANRVALAQLVAQGADLREQHLAKAVADLEKFEDVLMGAVRKAAAGADASVATPWGPVLEKLQAGGTASGNRASATAEQLLQDMHAAVRSSRAAGLKAAQAMAESYGAMVSGVLLGMAEALQKGGSATGGGAKKK